MGVIRKQSIQATLILAIGVILGLFLKLYIFTAYLDESQIGLLAVLLDTANLIAAFIPLGSQSIYVKYLPYFRDENGKARGLFSWGILSSLVGLLLFTLVFLLFKSPLAASFTDNAPLFAEYILYLLPLVLARVIFTIGMGYANALKKNVFPLVIKEILVRILTGILVISFAAKWFDLDGLVLWYVILYFISGAVMTWYLLHLKQLDLSFSRQRYGQGLGREILQFGLFAILTNVGTVVIRNIDTLMITTFRTLEDTGVYSIAFFIGMVIEMPRRAITQITNPFVAEAMAKNDMEQISILYHKSSVNQFLVGALLLICVWTNLDSLFMIIPNGENYVEGRYVVLFIGLGKLFDMSMGVNSNIIQNSQYYRFNFYNMGLLAGLAIVTNILLIPIYGIVGAAIASCISITLVNVARSVYIKMKFGLQPFRESTAAAIMICGITLMVATFLPVLASPLYDLFYRSAITIALFWILVLGFRVSEDFNTIFRQAVKRWILR